jgi:hypothetical protein
MRDRLRSISSIVGGLLAQRNESYGCWRVYGICRCRCSARGVASWRSRPHGGAGADLTCCGWRPLEGSVTPVWKRHGAQASCGRASDARSTGDGPCRGSRRRLAATWHCRVGAPRTDLWTIADATSYRSSISEPGRPCGDAGWIAFGCAGAVRARDARPCHRVPGQPARSSDCAQRGRAPAACRYYRVAARRPACRCDAALRQPAARP